MEIVKGEGCMYFFDMKEVSNGKFYFCIIEAFKNKEGEFQCNCIFVFEEDFEKFVFVVVNIMKVYVGLEGVKVV